MDVGKGGSSSSFSYYAILGVGSDSSSAEIKRAYRKLALQWHPDRWTRTSPSLLSEAKQKFQRIQEAYSVLSDHKKRAVYDAGLYDPEDEDEGFSEFMEEMVSLMAQVRREEKDYYSMEELQSLFTEMAHDFNNMSPSWHCGTSILDESFHYSKKIRLDKYGRT